MNQKQKAVFFYMGAIVIALVNAIMLCALVFCLLLNRPLLNIQWLLGMFIAEILALFAIAWRKIINVDESPVGSSNEPCRPPIKIVGVGKNQLAIEKLDVGELPLDADVILKNKGIDHLVNARDKKLAKEIRMRHAEEALSIFGQISKESPVYIAAQSNAATAHRVLGNYAKAIRMYESVQEMVLDSGSRFSDVERRNWTAMVSRMIGNVLAEQDHICEARAYFISSWVIEPNNIITLLNLLELAVKDGQIEETQQWADRLSRHHDDPSVSSLVESIQRPSVQDRHDESDDEA